MTNRLQELLSRDLSRGRDDDELDELEVLLATYRRAAVGTWEPFELEGQTVHRLELECGHVVILDEVPKAGIHRRPDGAEQSIPLTYVCHSCYLARGDA